MPKIIEGKIIAKGMRFGIVASRFNDFISGRLIEGAVDALTRAGAEEKEIQIVRVPGAFELPRPHASFRVYQRRGLQGDRQRGSGDRSAGNLRRPDDGHYRTSN
jgi:hypothetical protein